MDEYNIQEWNIDEYNSDSSGENEFLLKLEHSSKLKVLLEKTVDTLCRKHNKLGLFQLFFTRSYLNNVRTWTNQNLEANGKAPVNEKKFNAYIGLELAMSIVELNSIKHYWSTKMFSGHPDFKDVMSRDDFILIRSHLSLVSPGSVSADKKAKDPLWHLRDMMERFQKNCVAVAVPEGTIALHEASLATKARTKAKTFNATKPDKYAIHFYALVGNEGPYIFCLQDNRRGNTESKSAAKDYILQFPELRRAFYQHFDGKEEDMSMGSPSALWSIIMAHPTKKSQDPSGNRYFFMDNYYTCHILAKKIKDLTDGEARVIGTVKFINIDATNRIGVQEGLELLKDASRGEWCLVPAYDKVSNLE